MEASGTGNMKFAVNGALTIGTRRRKHRDYARGWQGEHIYLWPHERRVGQMRSSGYNPCDYYHNDPELRTLDDCFGLFTRRTGPLSRS